MLAGCTGTFGAILYMWMLKGKPDASMSGNGLLAGLVAITAPSGFVSTVGACIIGLVAGVLVCLSCAFVENVMKVDDPVGAISVHGTNGLWGVLSVGLFADGTSNYGGSWNGVTGSVTGLFYGDASQLAAQLVGISTLIGFVFTFSFLINLALEFFVGQRVSAETEIAGLDLPEMGQLGYPEFVFKPEPDVPAARRKGVRGRLVRVSSTHLAARRASATRLARWLCDFQSANMSAPNYDRKQDNERRIHRTTQRKPRTHLTASQPSAVSGVRSGRNARTCCCGCLPIRACSKRKSARTWSTQLRECVAQYPKVSELARAARDGSCASIWTRRPPWKSWARPSRSRRTASSRTSRWASCGCACACARKPKNHTRQAALLAQNMAQSELARRQAATIRTMMREGIERGGYRTPWLSLGRLRRLWTRNEAKPRHLATVDAQLTMQPALQLALLLAILLPAVKIAASLCTRFGIPADPRRVDGRRGSRPGRVQPAALHLFDGGQATGTLLLLAQVGGYVLDVHCRH